MVGQLLNGHLNKLLDIMQAAVCHCGAISYCMMAIHGLVRPAFLLVDASLLYSLVHASGLWDFTVPFFGNVAFCHADHHWYDDTLIRHFIAWELFLDLVGVHFYCAGHIICTNKVKNSVCNCTENCRYNLWITSFLLNLFVIIQKLSVFHRYFLWPFIFSIYE